MNRLSRTVCKWLALPLVLAAAACERAGHAAWGPGAELSGDSELEPAAAPPAAAAGMRTPAVDPLEERAAVATVGLDSVLLAEALDRAATLPRLHNMIVARHGAVIAERHFRGPALGTPANVKSVSKSLLSALVGIAIAEGHLQGIEQPIGSYFPQYVNPASDPVKAGITVGQLLAMRSGLESTSNANYGRWVNSSNWVSHALGRPLLAEPGERMIYSTGNSHLLSAVLTAATGQSTHAFAQQRLAEPLGIRLPPWLRDPQGIFFGGNDMHISPRDLLRFGELYRNGGEYEGRQILPREWIVESWRVEPRAMRGRDAYGLGWFGRPTNGYALRFAWGYGGQFLFIVPALELTIVFTSDPVSPREGPHNRALHDLVDQLLVPAAIRGG